MVNYIGTTEDSFDHDLREYYKYEKSTGKARELYLECKMALVEEMYAQGIDKQYHALLKRGLASRHAFIDFASGNTIVFRAKEALAGIMNDRNYGEFVKSDKAADPEVKKTHEELTAHMSPSQKIAYARRNNLK